MLRPRESRINLFSAARDFAIRIPINCKWRTPSPEIVVVKTFGKLAGFERHAGAKLYITELEHDDPIHRKVDNNDKDEPNHDDDAHKNHIYQ